MLITSHKTTRKVQMTTLHVAVGIIYNQQQQILVAKRPEHTDQGGLWEFPGGKIEIGETVRQALVRELQEEIGIDVVTASPLIAVTHDYGDKRVLLDVWQVTEFSGIARGNEGQIVRWVTIEECANYKFPKANLVILEKIQARGSKSNKKIFTVIHSKKGHLTSK
jgi:8-oxo-dGTP diphosphatase